MDSTQTYQGTRSLFRMAMAVVRKNIRSIEDLGDTPTHIALPLLKHVQRPEQLATIEENSPALKAETHELWFNFIKRDVFNWEKMLLEKRKQNGDLWTEEEVKQKTTYKTYQRCMVKAEEAGKEAEEKLRQNMQAAQNAAVTKETRLVNRVPNNWQKKRGTQQNASSGVLRFTSGSRTRTDTGKSALNKIYREAADAKLKRPGSVMAKPAHMLNKGGPSIIVRRKPEMRGLLSGQVISKDRPQSSTARPSTAAPRMPQKSSSTVAQSQSNAPKDQEAARESPAKAPTQRPMKRKPETMALMASKRRK